MQLDLRRSSCVELDLVDHARRGGDQVEIVFAGQPLLDDLEVEQPQEAAAEAEAERGAELSISKLNEASLSRSLPMLSRSFSKSAASTGNSPQNTTGWTSLKPGSASAAGRLASVIVSPTRGLRRLP